MKEQKISIGIGSVEDAARDVIEAWHRAEQGQAPLEPRAKILFTELDTLVRMLTPRRLELLKHLRRTGAMSIRALSKALGRDYKPEHTQFNSWNIPFRGDLQKTPYWSAGEAGGFHSL